MRAEVQALHSPDAPQGLDRLSVPDPEAFSILVEATIGLSGSAGGDLFQFHVVGARWFAANAPGKGFRWGRGFLVLDRWDYNVLHGATTDVCAHAEGEDWAAIAPHLSRYGLWEFEDYRELPG